MWCVRVGRPPLLFIAMEMSVLENIPSDATSNRRGGGTRRRHMAVGGERLGGRCGRTLGVATLMEPACNRLLHGSSLLGQERSHANAWPRLNG